MWNGCLTALVTPFRGNEIDDDALTRLVEAQIAGGVQGLVPCGSTGESATLTHEEHVEVIKRVVKVAAGRVPVIAGSGSNSTNEAVRLTRAAEEVGADGALLISPYYNRPTQEGIYQHYRKVADATKLKLLVYNIPVRTASNILPDTLRRLSQIENIVGVKEASGSLGQVYEVIGACGPHFAVYAGDDVLTVPIMAIGGVGVISVASNVVPERMVEITSALSAGDFIRGRARMLAALALVQALGLEVNPIPVKTALALMGRCREDMRLPLTPMSPEARKKLEAVLHEYHLV